MILTGSALSKPFSARRTGAGNQTLEDYALRFTSLKARRWSISQVGHTALGVTAFMALEAIAAAITLQYGFINSLWAMLTVSVVIFITGFPIVYYAAKYGLDIDLLTHGAGFGYLGPTVTSLIYATFTFIFFAIEAAILASALQALTGLPLALDYVVSAVAAIPIVTHGILAISKFQLGTQSFWLLLQIAALLLVAGYELHQVCDWTRYAPATQPGSDVFNLTLFGAAAAVLFALMAQIGEQVDYLRFLPEKRPGNRRQWWFHRLVELLLALDPQPSGAGGLAVFQCRHRAAADGTGYLPGTGIHPRHVRDCRGQLAGDAVG